MMAQRSALVTGATGFVGRRLCERLKREGWRVIAVARRRAPGPWDELVVHEFGSGPLVLTERPDAVFHLAGRAHALAERPGEREAYFRVNVTGTKELMEALGDDRSVRIVFTSSVKAQGEETAPEGVNEEAPCRPTTPYGESKLAAERTLLTSPFGAQAIVLRLAMVFGEGQKGNLVEMIRAVAKWRFPPIPENGNRRSMVNVEDVVVALLAAMAAPAKRGGSVYFVAGPRAFSSREIYVAICHALGRSPPFWVVPVWALRLAGRAGDLIAASQGRRFLWDSDKCAKLFGSACYRPDKAMGELGFSPRTKLEAILPAMVREVLAKRGPLRPAPSPVRVVT